MEHGGKRKGAGRKPKAEEIKLIEQLDEYIAPDLFVKELASLIKKSSGQVKLNALKLYAEYRFGKPSQSIDLTTGGESFKPIPPIEWTRSK